MTCEHFTECSGNGLTEWKKLALRNVQGTHGLPSTWEWTGVLVSPLAREVGLNEGGAWVLAECADAAVTTRSISLEKPVKDGIIAYGQNGDPAEGVPCASYRPVAVSSTSMDPVTW